MPQDRSSLKLSFIHSVASTKEIAETHVTLADVTNTPANTGVEALALLDGTAMGQIFDAYNTLLTDLSGSLADYSNFTTVKAAAIGTNGKYADPSAHPSVVVVGTGVAGTATNVPPQTTTVAGLRSDLVSGRRTREGRMFLPHLRASMQAGTPFSSASSVTSFASYVADFISALNALTCFTTVSFEVCILGHLATAPGTPGHGQTADCQKVTKVRVGNVIDTQQRRHHQLSEVYTTQTI